MQSVKRSIVQLSSVSNSKSFLSFDDCQAIFNSILSSTTGGGDVQVSIVSSWQGISRWAQNRMYVTSDQQDLNIAIRRKVGGSVAVGTTSRSDASGLKDAIRYVESMLRIQYESPNPEQIKDPFIDEPISKPTIWSDATYGLSTRDRTALTQSLIELVEQAKSTGLPSGFSSSLSTAGEFVVAANGIATFSTQGLARYYTETSVECSMTVRDVKSQGSGWAGINHYALEKIDPRALAACALDKCQRSVNPVALEPGRYTVILEPQAVSDLFRPVVQGALGRQLAEMPEGPFGKAPNLSRITERVLDRRFVLSADPMDLEGGFAPFERYEGTPYRPVNWIERGVLKELAYDREYALSKLNTDKALPNSGSFRLVAAPGLPTGTIDEMISKTARGILVTRLSGVTVTDLNSVMCTGYTRDGVWLIESGKLTKPLKNFRFRDSPVFALNNVLDIGKPERVYAPGYSHIVPAVRVQDFNLANLADSV